MTSVTDMLGSVAAAKTDALSAASIFKNPAASAMGAANDMSGKLSMIPGLDMSSFSSKLDGLTSFAQSNISSKLSSLPSVMPMINAHQANINSIANIDGIPNPLAGCGFMDEVMKSLTSAGDKIDGVMAKANGLMNDAMKDIPGAIDFITTKVDDVLNWVKSTSATILGKIQTALAGVMKDITGLIDDAKKELTELIAKEEKLLKEMVDDLLDFSFLKGLVGLGPCGSAVMSKCLDLGKVDLGKIASL